MRWQIVGGLAGMLIAVAIAYIVGSTMTLPIPGLFGALLGLGCALIGSILGHIADERS